MRYEKELREMAEKLSASDADDQVVAVAIYVALGAYGSGQMKDLYEALRAFSLGALERMKGDTNVQ